MIQPSLLYLASFFLALPINFGLCDREVFAHHMIGLTYGYTIQDFANDVNAASAAGIDGFALNIDGNFKLFISFDYAANWKGWTPEEAIAIIHSYSSSPAQFRPAAAGDWAQIKQQTDAFFVPDYSSRGPSGAAALPNVDGLFPRDAWPDYKADVPTSDQDYKAALGNRPFMMPVSPWFYTNVPKYGKNWLWHTTNLWPLRWQQYEGDIPTGALWYVQNIPHNAWLNDLPYYIRKYKDNGAEPPAGSYTPHVTFWYRLNPNRGCSDDGTTCNSQMNGQPTFPPQECTGDAVSFSIFAPTVSIVQVSVGGVSIGSSSSTGLGVFSGSFTLKGKVGPVTISASLRDGTKLGPVTGPAITTACFDGGRTNWNVWVGGT
ncbi:glycoside hydrolase family 71 protein [Patellaria atrata CBS 101060]|uniref:Glycoside hydrolase family 71 protein n=1 Tax=Patellaria atrata CBS 101060 TaxID=1346257 RepID=A0A9P4VTR2_9PEZI|nr:glycoside hydrolase family 71 protein [Patellaria atrata CBS 101060]